MFQSTADMLQNYPVYTPEEADALEKATRDQSGSQLWHEHRQGRITASVVHSFKSKVSSGKLHDVQSVMQKLFSQNDISHLPAVKYGVHNEPIAADWYFQDQSKKHRKMKI